MGNFEATNHAGRPTFTTTVAFPGGDPPDRQSVARFSIDAAEVDAHRLGRLARLALDRWADMMKTVLADARNHVGGQTVGGPRPE